MKQRKPHYQTEGRLATESRHALQVIADTYILPFLLQQGHIHVQMFAVCACCDLQSKVQAVLLIGLLSAFLLTFLRHSRVPFLLLQQNLVDPVLFCRQ